jgi:thioredoxin 1
MPTSSVTTAQELQALLATAGAERLVVLDFSAEWCGPCKRIGPVFHALVEGLAPRGVLGVTVDLDDAEELAKHFKVQSVPTFVLLRGGSVVHSLTGADAPALEAALQLYSQAAPQCAACARAVPQPHHPRTWTRAKECCGPRGPCASCVWPADKGGTTVVRCGKCSPLPAAP